MPKISIHSGWCRAIGLYIAIALTGLTVDLATKYWAFLALGMPGTYKTDTALELNHTHWIWLNVVGFQTSLNSGALFGIGQGQSTFLVILSVVFLTGIILYVLFWAWQSLFYSVILGMITAGICGNLYDRLGWHGLTDLEEHRIYAVRDWILCMIGSFPWPNFNIADSLLVCSIALLLLQEFLQILRECLFGKADVKNNKEGLQA